MALLDGNGPRIPGQRTLTAAAPSSSRSSRSLIPAAAEPSSLSWRQRYARMLTVTDFFVILWAAAGAHFVQSSFSIAALGVDPFAGSYLATTGVVIVLWSILLAVFDSRDSRMTGFGSEEYKRVLNATFVVFALIAMTAFLFGLTLPRGYLLVVMPAGLLGLIAGRWVWRRWLHQQRDRAEYSFNVLAVGNVETVRDLVSELRRSPRAGYRVVGACVTGGTGASAAAGAAAFAADNILGVPIVGSLTQVTSAVDLTKADVVAVTATAALGPVAVRELSWDLEKTNAELILAPALTDIAMPRVHTHPVAGLPLIHVERPSYSRPTRLIKTAFDVIGAITLLLLLSPVILVIGAAIKLTSPGPVFFRQERVGVEGKRFKMIKFRSMRVDAEALLEELRAQQRDAGNEVLFKIKDDPRITKVGKFIRRFSLDEVPQLLNVVCGEMSLVGPRPPLAAEVAQYQDEAHRRLLVKPGMTGLWQVSGRSDLSWEESVRLDLSYVENWSITGDLVILFKTVKAVAHPSGAY